MLNFPHQAWDIGIILFFNQYCGSSSFWDTLALVFLSVDALRTAVLVSLIVGLWEYGNVKKDSSSKKRVLYILFSIIVTLGIIEIMNAIIHSPRPIVTYESLIKAPIVSNDIEMLWNNSWVRNSKHGSFPSDTVALLFTMAVGLFLWEKLIGSFAIAFVLITCVLPRLYFGLHYPSDMLVAMVISIFSSMLVEKTKFCKTLSDFLFKIEQKSPYIFGVIGFYLAYVIAEKFILIRKLPIWIKAMFSN